MNIKKKIQMSTHRCYKNFNMTWPSSCTDFYWFTPITERPRFPFTKTVKQIASHKLMKQSHDMSSKYNILDELLC